MGPLVGCIGYVLHVLVVEWLMQKRLDPTFSIRQVNETKLYLIEPSELPGLSEIQSDNQVWYFFCEPSYTNDSSKKTTHRKVGTGYWKITGRPCGVKDKNSQKIGSKRTLVFYKRQPGRHSKDAKTLWVMHEFYVKDSPRFKKNYVICYVEKQANKGPSVSTPADGQTSPSLAYVSANHVMEDTFTYKVQYQQPPSRPSIFDTGNHITESTSAEVAPQPGKTLVSDFMDRVAKNIFRKVEPQEISSQNLASDSGTDAAETSYSTVRVGNTVDPQLLSCQYLVYGPPNHVCANASSMVPSAEFGAFNACYGQNHCPALQMPINPQQRFYSTYSNNFSEDIQAWISQFNCEHENVANSQHDFQDERPREGTGQTLPDGTNDEIVEMVNELLAADIPPFDCANYN